MINNKATDTRPLMVSIRCLTYNHAPYIRQCLEGFVMQKTNFRFEAIVHDDASTDGTADIILEYANKYPNIIKPILETENQFSKCNGGIRRIMNEACTGKYIALCEGDDYWIDPNKLQIQVDFLENHPEYTMVCSRTKRFSQIRKEFVSDVSCNGKDGNLSPKDIIKEGGLYIATCSILFNKDIKQNYPEYCQKCHVGDYPLQIMCAMKGKVWFFNKAMAVYRIEHPGSWCQKQIKERITSENLKNYLSEVCMLKGFSNNYPQYSQYFYKRILIYLYSFLPNKELDPVGYDNFIAFFSEVIKELSLKDRALLWLKASKYASLWYIYISVGTKIKKWLHFTTI